MRAQSGLGHSENNRTDIIIEEKAHLTITMTIESKNRKKTIYRIFQRPDGVIVETPRYRPSSALLPNRESNASAMAVRAELSKIDKERSHNQRGANDDLRGIGSWDGELANQRGRDGYNGPTVAPLTKVGFEPLCQH